MCQFTASACPEEPPSLPNCKQMMEMALECDHDQKRNIEEAEPLMAAPHHNADLNRSPSASEVLEELKEMGKIGGPMVCLGLLLYGRMVTSMFFLGRLGELELAGGSLAIGLANITCYSVLSGLALGMEPICGQAFGAKKWSLMGLALQRTILVLLCFCLPIAFLWLNMHRILLWCGQDSALSDMASTYLLYSLPNLVAQAILNPLRIYLRTQTITSPLAICTFAALLLHLIINYALVDVFGMRIGGVALAASWTDFNLVLFLLCYLWFSDMHKKTWDGWSLECLRDWKPLLYLAVPSCLSVCLEWWWYELMIVFSSFLPDSQATVAAMGILIQTTSLVYIFPSSLSLAVSTRVGNELGANRPVKARFAMLVAVACACILAILAMTFTTTMRHVWGAIFTSNPHILSLVAVAMPIVGLCELGNCPQTAGCGVLRGSARPSTGANINLGSFYIVGLPVALVLGLKMGFVGLWCGLLAAQATCVLLMLYVLRKTDWNLQAMRAQVLTGMCEGDTNQQAVPSLEKGCEGGAEHELEHLVLVKIET
ncbi:hypothetical protein GOP47_0004234 [Adiantum capillus-veneris]|uniref:Protein DETOXIFICATION n=1 Tax=Adiantum capillus-veneris TaxID=13818 RepID=A0A9D4V8A6_ADICA|nr:hypothetical protein GOP47_0004234 [Adiantum capillus-veneris]